MRYYTNPVTGETVDVPALATIPPKQVNASAEPDLAAAMAALPKLLVEQQISNQLLYMLATTGKADATDAPEKYRADPTAFS